jgi:ferredoxin-type protein NapG
LPLAEKRDRLIGIAKIDLDTCAMANGQECTACIRACPFEALIVVGSEDSASTQPKLLPSKCNGCGGCEVVCPVWPKVAIRVVPLKGERT